MTYLFAHLLIAGQVCIFFYVHRYRDDAFYICDQVLQDIKCDIYVALFENNVCEQ